MYFCGVHRTDSYSKVTWSKPGELDGSMISAVLDIILDLPFGFSINNIISLSAVTVLVSLLVICSIPFLV